MRTLHLFAGAGGGLLADILLGHTPVCAVEWDAYCCQVLRERRDEGWFPGLEVWEGDVRGFPAEDWAGRVDCVHAGFPCQPFSVAGKRCAAADERNGWPWTIDVLRRIRPRWALLENVPGLLSGSHGYFGTVLGDLAEAGFDARWTVLSAASVGANHCRKRLWVLAHAARELQHRRGEPRPGWRPEHPDSREAMAHARRPRLPVPEHERQHGRPTPQPGWWATEPDVGRVAHGVADRVHRLRALGNGQVPLQAAAAWVMLGGPVQHTREEDPNMSNPTIETIIREYLAAHGHDGMWSADLGCACRVGDLFPCAWPSPDCRAGYKTPCDCEDNCGWHIGKEKKI